MTAQLRLFENADCSSDLNYSGSVYDVFLGPEIGLDGDAGDAANQTIYVKNVGDAAALNVMLVFNNNPGGMLTATKNGTYTADNISLGNILPSYVVTVFLKFTVPAGTIMTGDRPNISFKYTVS